MALYTFEILKDKTVKRTHEKETIIIDKATAEKQLNREQFVNLSRRGRVKVQKLFQEPPKPVYKPGPPLAVPGPIEIIDVFHFSKKHLKDLLKEKDYFPMHVKQKRSGEFIQYTFWQTSKYSHIQELKKQYDDYQIVYTYTGENVPEIYFESDGFKYPLSINIESKEKAKI